MSVDPTVQVAAISVISVTITTLGLIAVAIINNRKERSKAASAGVEAGLDERTVLGRIFSLMSEIEEKDELIELLRGELAVKEAENRLLRDKKSSGKGGKP